MMSCDQSRVYEENQEINAGIWDMKQKPVFEFDIPDTVTRYNLYFNMRHTDTYYYSNMYVFFHTTMPNGKISTDTVEFQLADPTTGQWLGKGQSTIHDCQMCFRRGMRFPVAGHYSLSIEQAMRMEQLPGVVDAGLRIERAN
jgi:gliding motility-associated lipoprotein GldH